VEPHPDLPWQPFAQQPLAPADELLAGKTGALEGRVSLGHERRDGDRDARAPRRRRPGIVERRRRQGGDGRHVVVGLTGQTDHEVQLQAAVAGPKDAPHGRREVLLVDPLVDGVAQRLGAGFGGQRDRATLLVAEARQYDRRRVDPQRGQRHAHVREPFADAGDGLAHAAVVARRQRDQRDLVAARGSQGARGGLDDHGDRSLAHRAVPHAGLAEPAAGGAAAHDLDHRPVVDSFDERHQRLGDR
jgi:hypothetical protein